MCAGYKQQRSQMPRYHNCRFRPSPRSPRTHKPTRTACVPPSLALQIQIHTTYNASRARCGQTFRRVPRGAACARMRIARPTCMQGVRGGGAPARAASRASRRAPAGGRRTESESDRPHTAKVLSLTHHRVMASIPRGMLSYPTVERYRWATWLASWIAGMSTQTIGRSVRLLRSITLAYDV